MPLSGGTTGAHDDAAHQGSAKRDVVDGVAGLGPAGNVLAVGPDLELTRDVSENIEIVERTSGNIVFRWTRIGVNDFECRVNCGGVACIIQNDSMKDVAGGIAGLDGSIEIPVALLKTNVANGVAGLDAAAVALLAQIPGALTGKKTDLNLVGLHGSFAGNNTVNRAIPHGLGRTPIFHIYSRDDIGHGSIQIDPGYISTIYYEAQHHLAVTASDDTNFYVGNASNYGASANATGRTYDWVVIG